ncbi:unnamed protein product [Camellia sinensis]
MLDRTDPTKRKLELFAHMHNTHAGAHIKKNPMEAENEITTGLVVSSDDDDDVEGSEEEGAIGIEPNTLG